MDDWMKINGFEFVGSVWKKKSGASRIVLVPPDCDVHSWMCKIENGSRMVRRFADTAQSAYRLATSINAQMLSSSIAGISSIQRKEPVDFRNM